MDILFYLHATFAVLSMAQAMITPQAIHALLYAVFSLLNIAITMYVISAPLAAALLAIIYAGAIMVLFVFVVMLMKAEVHTKKIPQKKLGFFCAIALAGLFIVDVVLVLKNKATKSSFFEQPLHNIAKALINDNSFLLEMASLVLLAGLITSIFIGIRFVRPRKSPVLDI